jgi:hypothetical protein
MAAGGGHGGGAILSPENVPPTQAVLFVVTCLFIGLCAQQFGGRLLRYVPFTAVLLVAGLGVGLLQAIPPATAAFTGARRGGGLGGGQGRGRHGGPPHKTARGCPLGPPPFRAQRR